MRWLPCFCQLIPGNVLTGNEQRRGHYVYYLKEVGMIASNSGIRKVLANTQAGRKGRCTERIHHLIASNAIMIFSCR